MGCYQGLPDGRFAGAGDTNDTDHLAIPWDAEESSTGEPDEPDTWGEESTDGPDSTEPPGLVRMGAADITPTGLHLNQGVAVTIADNGAPIAREMRTAPVLHGRRTLVYGTWSLGPSFVPRTIRGELHLVYEDGSEEVVVDEIFVDGPSGPNPADAHFEWPLEPAQIREGTQWSVTLHELHFPPDDIEPPPVPSLPTVGHSPLDHLGQQRLRIVFVPYRHQRTGCDKVAPHDATTIENHRRLMEMTYPTQKVEIEVQPVRVFTGSSASLDGLLTDLLELRAAQSPAADVYYYGLINPCNTTNAGGLGYVPYNPDSVGDAQWRVSVGVFYDFDPNYTLWTMVHEIGHNHGRNHVACAGSEGNSDPEYPIPGGTIGVRGWGIHDGQFRAASATDYMSYCPENMWASSYAWWKTFAVIDALTAAVGASSSPQHDEAPGPGAIALAVRAGEITAARHIRGLRTRNAHTTARWQMNDGRVAETLVQRDHVPDSESQFFTVAVPSEGLDHVLSFELDASDGTTTIVPRDRILSR